MPATRTHPKDGATAPDPATPSSVVAAMVRKFGDARCGLGMTRPDIERHAIEGMDGGRGTASSPSELAEASIRRNLPLYHQRLLYRVARRFTRRSATPRGDIEDLVGAGQLGLIRAARLYDPGLLHGDPAQPYRFSTYAFRWIKQFVHHERWRQEGVVHVPIYVRTQLSVARNRGVALDQLDIGESARECVAAAADILSRSVVPGGGPIVGGTSLLDVPCDEDRDDTDGTADLAAECVALLRILSPRERALVEAKYGLDGRDDPPREVLAAEHGISCGHVSVIRRESMARLKEEAERLGMAYRGSR